MTLKLCKAGSVSFLISLSTSGLTSPGVKEEQEPGQQGGGGPRSHSRESVQKMSELECVHAESGPLLIEHARRERHARGEGAGRQMMRREEAKRQAVLLR